MLGPETRSTLPLFERFPRLADSVSWHAIGDWPTPVTQLPNFARAHGLTHVHAKREDLNHPTCGGSKLRGLEFLLARARQRKAKTIITFGAVGSHHVRTTAWHAGKLGIDTVALVMSQPGADYVRHNLLAGIEAGTRFVPVNVASVGPRFIAQWLRAVSNAHSRPFFIPPGGTSPLACLGHVSAALELKRQTESGILPEPRYIFLPLGSLGTAAGLLVGCKLAGLQSRLVGVTAFSRWYCTPGRWIALARRTLRLMQKLDATVPSLNLDRSDVTVVTSAPGKGYGHATEESTELARQIRAADNLELDRTYTAKTLAGALHYLKRNKESDAESLLWHTYRPAESSTSSADPIAELPPALRAYFKG
ncbi:MAG: pyridoxal-phosphate dependent enzyme [Planctomycetota bacterium]|nr:pyridoxal-phosphate dependent enzyme [Planctomycetota bacterium]